jgi:catechol 2,3-dioxygenase-like lactoylglutathione lyase family enzyme
MAHLNHVGLTVTDLDRSIAFYTEVAGFTLARPAVRVEGDWFDTLTHNEGASLDAATLDLDGFTLQLVQYHDGGAPAIATGHNHVGNMHLCIYVDDVDAKHAAITATGLHNPTPIVHVMRSPTRSFYVDDPDGIPVEFLQRA